MDAVARTGIPYVGSCGALDMAKFGPRSNVPSCFSARRLYAQNPQVALMRTTPTDCVAIRRYLAGKLNACRGPVRFLSPAGGVSALNVPGAPFCDPEADEALFATLEREVEQTQHRRLVRLPYHINEPAFAYALVSSWREVQR